MDEEMRKEFPYEVRVKLEGFRKYKGYSDLIDNLLLLSDAVLFRVFPGIGYEGYFEKKNVEIRKRKEAEGQIPKSFENTRNIR